MVVAALTAGAGAAAGALGATGPSGPTGPAGPTGPTGPSGPAKPKRHLPPVRYRAVGCELRTGTAAVLHGPRKREVALTFDDGPWPDTPQFLGTLERLRVPATFFMIGEQVATHAADLARELRDGDVLGNHSFTHPDLATSGNVAGQLSTTTSAIVRTSGYRPCLFRPPYGATDSAVQETAHSLGLSTIVWDVDPRDWSLPGTPAIIDTVLAQAHAGSIILMHEGGGPRGETLAALPTIVKGLRSRGLRPVTLLQLLGGHTIYRRCRALCGGAAVRGPLPRGSIIRRG